MLVPSNNFTQPKTLGWFSSEDLAAQRYDKEARRHKVRVHVCGRIGILGTIETGGREGVDASLCRGKWRRKVEGDGENAPAATHQSHD